MLLELSYYTKDNNDSSNFTTTSLEVGNDGVLNIPYLDNEWPPLLDLSVPLAINIVFTPIYHTSNPELICSITSGVPTLRNNKTDHDNYPQYYYTTSFLTQQFDLLLSTTNVLFLTFNEFNVNIKNHFGDA